jgi:hypothetical protein
MPVVSRGGMPESCLPPKGRSNRGSLKSGLNCQLRRWQRRRFCLGSSNDGQEEEVERIKREAVELFGDEEGKLDLEALVYAPRMVRDEKQLREKCLLEDLNLI